MLFWSSKPDVLKGCRERLPTKKISLVSIAIVLPCKHPRPRLLPLAFLPFSFAVLPSLRVLRVVWILVAEEHIRIVRVEFHKTLEVPVQQWLVHAFVLLCGRSVRMDEERNSPQTQPFDSVPESAPTKYR